MEEIGGGENATQKALNLKISAQACFVYSLEKQGVSAAFLKCFFFCLFFSMLNAAGFGQWGVYKNKFFSVSFGFSLIHSQILGGSIQFFSTDFMPENRRYILGILYWILQIL